MPEANPDDAPFWQLLVSISEKLKGLTFEPAPEDLGFTLQPENIEIWKGDQSVGVVTPALLVTPGPSASAPWEAGTEAELEVYYNIAVQVIDREPQRKLDGFRTHLKWANQIARSLSAPTLQLVDYASSGVSYEISQVQQVTHLDTKEWQVHSLFRAGVIVQAVVRETWGD